MTGFVGALKSKICEVVLAKCGVQVVCEYAYLIEIDRNKYGAFSHTWRLERSSTRPDQDASRDCACCFDQKEESSQFGRDLPSSMLLKAEMQWIPVELAHKVPLVHFKLKLQTRSTLLCKT
jgi:hypothetical protein